MIEISPQLREQFNALSSQWLKESGGHSSIARMADHDAHRAIVAMGMPAAVMILERFAMGRVHHWFLALREITGADPVEDKHRGLLDKMAGDWLKWGREQSIID